MTSRMKTWHMVMAAMSIAAAAANAMAADAPASSADAPRACEADYPGCPCPADLSKVPITLPPGMTLDNGTCMEQGGRVNSGDFTFSGDVTVTGNVFVRLNDMSGRANMAFEAAQSHAKDYVREQYLQFAYVIDGFRLNDDDARLRPLPVSDTQSCWAAPAVLKVRVIRTIVSDQDDDGNYALNYEVLKLGKYRKCTAHEASGS